MQNGKCFAESVLFTALPHSCLFVVCVIVYLCLSGVCGGVHVPGTGEVPLLRESHL